MSTFRPQYPYQPQQFFYEQSAFELAHNDARRSKTPTESMINHTGLSPGSYSPGPLITTPPPLSRNPSHQPVPLQEQIPEQSTWDNGSFSNSPTSVRTPDNDSFEVEMLDSDIGRFYQDTNIMSTQSSQNNVPAVDSTMFFTDQGTSQSKSEHVYAYCPSNPRGSPHHNGSSSAIPAFQYASSTATKHITGSTTKHFSRRELHHSSTGSRPVSSAGTLEWSRSIEIWNGSSVWACHV